MRRPVYLMTAMGIALGLACTPQEQARVEAAAEEAVQETEQAIQQAAAQAEEAIMELERTWSRKAGEKDLDWIAGRLAGDTRLMPPNAEPAVGREAVMAWWRETLGTEGLSVSWEPTGAHVSSSGDMAYDLGTYTLTTPDGAVDRGKYLVVWVKEDGQWKIAADMFSSNLPPPGQDS